MLSPGLSLLRRSGLCSGGLRNMRIAGSRSKMRRTTAQAEWKLPLSATQTTATDTAAASAQSFQINLL